MRFYPLAIILPDNIQASINFIKKVISIPVVGESVRAMIRTIMDAHWQPEIKKILLQYPVHRENYERFVRSV